MAITEHVPVLLVIVYFAPELVHAPELVKTIAIPLAPPVAATVKLLFKFAVAGGFVVNVIVCWARVALTVVGPTEPELYSLVTAAAVAVTMQAVVPLFIVTLPAVFVQPPLVL